MKGLKEIIEESARRSREKGVFNTTAECFEDLKICEKCPQYENNCKDKIEAYIRELKNTYY